MAGASIPPEPDFLIQLRRTQHAVRTWLDAELAGTGLTTPQYTVLAALERQWELSASDLARQFGMTAQTVNVLVKGLEKSGLVRRSPHPDHGRILRLTLTPRGRKALAHGREIALGIQRRALDSLTPADRRRLTALLEALEETAAESAN